MVLDQIDRVWPLLALNIGADQALDNTRDPRVPPVPSGERTKWERSRPAALAVDPYPIGAQINQRLLAHPLRKLDLSMVPVRWQRKRITLFLTAGHF